MKNYVSVGNIIEQERLKRQAQIAKGIDSEVLDHIEKAHDDEFSKACENQDSNLEKFANDVDGLNKAETEFLLSKIQRQINADPESQLLKSFRSIAIAHVGDIEKGVYADNALNRKLGRVGQTYGGKKKVDEPSSKKPAASKAEPKKAEKKTEKKKEEKLTADAAAKFLSEHGEDYMSYQYGDMEDDDLYDKFDAAAKFIKDFKQFDWKQEDEADEYKSKMEAKGYHVIDVGNGDTIAYALIKKDKK